LPLLELQTYFYLFGRSFFNKGKTMAQVFNASEVFDIGVQIEKNGKEFYLAAEKRSNDPFLKTMFSQLAAWEGNHVELFEQLSAFFLNCRITVRI
jgi:rubrerythrin